MPTLQDSADDFSNDLSHVMIAIIILSGELHSAPSAAAISQASVGVIVAGELSKFLMACEQRKSGHKTRLRNLIADVENETSQLKIRKKILNFYQAKVPCGIFRVMIKLHQHPNSQLARQLKKWLKDNPDDATDANLAQRWVRSKIIELTSNSAGVNFADGLPPDETSFNAVPTPPR